ncbi:AT-rich interactive domain-containing protein 1B [Geodia barretti]|nr:AT-rich interactive domain-containing protein 1B [Geodia barretti]
MQKSLWPEVMQLLSPSAGTCAGSIRTLMRFYVRLLLPYECHVRNDSVSDCLSKVDTSIFMHTVLSKVIDEKNDGRGSDDGDSVVSEKQMNGEARRVSRRLNSQTSESSAGENSSQEHESRDKEDGHPSDIQEKPTTPVGTYPQEVSSDEPLPEISAQETESLLAMPASPYLQPPVTTGVPSTPSADPATPPSSFPPPYAPQGSQEWGQNSDVFTSYPSSYSMDISTYRPPPHVAPLPPGYNPFAPPSQHDMSMDYHLDMPSPMMRSPYDTAPYHMGMPPGMHGLPSSRPNPYLYRSHMMPRDPFIMRGNDMMYSGMNSDWAWQQGAQFSGMMHHHGMQLPSRSSQGVQPSPTSRGHLQQPPPHLSSSANQSSASGGEVTKPWLENPKGKQSDRTNSQSRAKAEYKTVSSKSDHPQMLDSLKRPLPDWSGCVEGTKPHLAKRKHLLSVDCGNVEPWRVMMSLKSGLLSESTWALDTLNILLHDDTTVGYFHLKHHHSLLNTLVDHLSKVLRAVFKDEFDSLPCHPDYNCSDMATTLDIYGPDVSEQLTEYRADNGGGHSPHHTHDRQCPLEECITNFRDDHRLSHIQLPTADERLLFAECKDVRQIIPECRSICQNLQRIDETPVSDIKHRENLRNQLPLHYFGRSPRRREHSILEDIQIREELEKEIDERLHSDVDNEERLKVNNEQKLREVFPSPGQITKEIEVHALKEESEIYQKEPLPLWSLPPNKEILQGRCLCLSNILRSLSFIPGNDVEFSQHPGVLTMLGRILMLHHNHLIQHKRPGILPLQLVGAGTSEPTSAASEPPLPGIDVWWWDCLDVLRENSLVILSNISGQLDLSVFPESVSCPIITGLLHWVSCPSAMAVDPLPDTAMALSLSPQRLVLEALAKISISEINVDFILATPPVTRLDMLFMHLVHFIGQKKHPVMRQFALVLLSNLAQGNEAASRLLAQQKMVVPLLVECIESSEQTSCNSRGQFIGGYNPEDPNSLSVAMLRRAATTLHCLAKVPLNRTAFLPYRDRTLYLATSQYVEPSVSSILMDMIFELGKL